MLKFVNISAYFEHSVCYFYDNQVWNALYASMFFNIDKRGKNIKGDAGVKWSKGRGGGIGVNQIFLHGI